MNQLDRLEKRLRTLFETSATLLPWNDPNDRIVHQLCVAIQDLFMGDAPRDQMIAPVFQVNLNPLTLRRWQKQPDWEKILSDLLVSTAAEYGFSFHTTPAVHLAADALLQPEEVFINLKETPRSPSSETGVISLDPEGKPITGELQTVSTPLLILQGEKTVRLNRSVVNLGRKSSNHIAINDLRVSRNHAQIRKVKSDYVIFDVGSSGGTFINSNRVDQHTLRPGDVISLAGFTMIYTIDQSPVEETQKGITSEIKSADSGEKE